MISINLPYSGNRFKIKKITFEQIVDISRIILDGTDSDVVEYLETFFGIEDLTVVDKFYVLVKARELFISETVSLAAGDGNPAKVNLSILLDKITDIPQYSTTINVDGIVFELDIPHKFTYSTNKADIYDNIIRCIKLGDTSINFIHLSKDQKNNMLENLSPRFFKDIKKYTEALKLTLVLFEGKKKLSLEPIIVDFLSNDPVYLIKALYSDFDIQSCREIIFHLSQKIGETILFKSTMTDITMYINEVSTQSERSKGGNSTLEL